MNKKVTFFWMFLACICFQSLLISKEKMKMYVFYTPTHEQMFSEWFLPSIQDDFELVVERHAQECSTGTFMHKGWIETMHRKVDIIIRGIRENWGKIFIHSDIDIQFFAPMEEKILSLMGDNDMLIQLLDDRGVACAGFFACRGNDKTLQLWLEVKKRMLRNPARHDQDHLNDIIGAENYSGIKWSLLPIQFFSTGIAKRAIWRPGVEFEFPEDIVLQHATYVVGTANKIAQFTYVRNKFNEMKRTNK